MGILRTTLWTLGAMLAVGALLEGATHAKHSPRFVQTTLDRLGTAGARPWP